MLVARPGSLGFAEMRIAVDGNVGVGRLIGAVESQLHAHQLAADIETLTTSLLLGSESAGRISWRLGMTSVTIAGGRCCRGGLLKPDFQAACGAGYLR